MIPGRKDASGRSGAHPLAGACPAGNDRANRSSEGRVDQTVARSDRVRKSSGSARSVRWPRGGGPSAPVSGDGLVQPEFRYPAVLALMLVSVVLLIAAPTPTGRRRWGRDRGMRAGPHVATSRERESVRRRRPSLLGVVDDRHRHPRRGSGSPAWLTAGVALLVTAGIPVALSGGCCACCGGRGDAECGGRLAGDLPFDRPDLRLDGRFVAQIERRRTSPSTPTAPMATRSITASPS